MSEEVRNPMTGETFTVDVPKPTKRLRLRCTSPRERAEVARRIRAHAGMLGLKAQVEPYGAFAITVEATDDVLMILFEKTGS